MRRSIAAGFLTAVTAIAPFGCSQNRALLTRGPLADDHVGFGYFSHTQGDASQRNHKHFENFDLIKDADISGVRFWGLSDGTATPGLSNFADFTVEVWSAGEDGAPGELLATHTVSRTDAKPEATGRFGIGGPKGAGTGAEHRFTVLFDETVALKKETDYFLVIMASRIDKNADNFMWSDGQRDDGVSYSWSYEREQMIRIDDTDTALVILGKSK